MKTKAILCLKDITNNITPNEYFKIIVFVNSTF